MTFYGLQIDHNCANELALPLQYYDLYISYHSIYLYHFNNHH